MLRQSLPQTNKIFSFEESFARIVFFEHWDIRSSQDLQRLQSEGEHPLERSQFTVDGGVGRSFFLSPDNIGLDAVGRNIDSPVSSKSFPQVFESEFHLILRFAIVYFVVVHDVAGQFIKGGPFNLRTFEDPAINFSETLS